SRCPGAPAAVVAKRSRPQLTRQATAAVREAVAPERRLPSSRRALSPRLDEHVVGRGDDPQMFAHPGDRQQALDLPRATGHSELLTALLGALVRSKDHPQTRRVDEVEVLEVEDHGARSRLCAVDLAL